MRKLYIGVVFLLLFLLMINVDAAVKCEDGKPGDIINCSITKVAERNGVVSGIKVDKGLTFVSCDVCVENDYTIEANKTANFKFKIDASIKESKKLSATFGGETATINVVVESENNDNNNENNNNENSEEENDVTYYSVTLVPGKGKNNITKTCSVNSINKECNVTLDTLEDANFNGWGTKKDCTEGANGNIKVVKNITYYACYKDTTSESNVEDNNEVQSLNKNLLLKSLIVKNGDKEIDLGFSIRIFEYDITIPTDVTSLSVEALPQDESVKVEVKGQDNLTDKGVIEIKLTANDETINKYTINFTKSDEKKLPLLSNLVIGGYDINFEPEKFTYTLTIDKGITSLNIDAVVDDENLEKEVVGNENLKNGSSINIIVTDKLTQAKSTYVINIEQTGSNLFIYIGVAGIILVILIILLVIVVKKGKKTNNKPTQTGKNGKKTNISIPEVKPTSPVAPSTTTQSTVSVQSQNNDKKDEIETLDL